MENFEDCSENVKEKLREYPELILDQDKEIISLIHVIVAFTEAAAPVPSYLKAGVDKCIVNKNDCLGKTPLHYSVFNNNVEIVDLLLQAGADPNAQVSTCQANNSKGFLNNSRWCKLLKMLPSPDETTPLHIAVKKGHTEILKLLLEYSSEVNCRSLGEMTPLMISVSKKGEKWDEIIKILLDHGSDVNLTDNQGRTALFYATAYRNLKGVQLLLEAGGKLTKDKNQQSPLHEAAKRGALEILQLLLESNSCDENIINDSDFFGRTAIYWSACCGNTECFKLLIKHRANVALRKEDSNDTTMNAMFSTFSQPMDHLNEILNSSITLDEKNNNFTENSIVTIDFSLLVPFNDEDQMEAIEQILAAAGSRDAPRILQHPLVESFLRLKWRKIVYFFYLQLVTYFFFTVTLSIYVLMLVHSIYSVNEMMFMGVRYLLICLSSSLLGHAVVQLTLEITTLNIVSQYELWMYLLCNIFSLSIGFVGPSISNEIPIWIFHSSSVAVLVSWVELMLLIGRFPKYGYYALMFSVVLQNVIKESKVLCTFVCLIIGFAISFSIQFGNSEDFQDPWRAVVKTTVMMMGEFEYSNLFDNKGGNTTELPITSKVIFLFFIILTSIVLVNLMVGLAVSDIQTLQTEGQVRGLQKRQKFLRQLERVVHGPLVRSKYFPKILRDLLKRRCSIDRFYEINPSIYLTKKKFKKLPTELIESIVRQTKSRRRACERLQDVELRRFLNCLNTILEKYNSSSEICSNNSNK